MNKPEWKQFELAVTRFLKALDPTAEITHNKIIPDADTGHPRQRDIWIESKILNHFTVKILVSCKRYKHKINSQDLDAFIGEIRSAGAHKGVMYTHTGYTKPAIEKAKRLDISLCKLYTNQPPDIPESILLKAYCAVPKPRMNLNEVPAAETGIITWNDIFNMQINVEDKLDSVLNHIKTTYEIVEKESIERTNKSREFPEDLGMEFDLDIEGADGSPIKLQVFVRWELYQAKLSQIERTFNGGFIFFIR